MIEIACIGTGIGIGAAVGAAKITIPINGSRQKFDQNKPLLNDYSLNQNPALGGKTFRKLPSTVTDIDGNIYHTLSLGGQVWMAENLKTTHFCSGKEIPDIGKKIPGSGCQYDWLAVADEWTSLYNSLGGGEAAGVSLEDSFSTGGATRQWWSSTAMNADNAHTLYLNTETSDIMLFGVAKNSKLSVRCIRNN
ncbi:MAG: hypothetical protein NTW16_19620 [Bacteroidetes bacterium]|nr:hypothetical protein [Bacteroidota bacterium]